ncbi:hypothetical protein BH20CHL1_BH20CHL1_04730 [soil metagenome]
MSWVIRSHKPVWADVYAFNMPGRRPHRKLTGIQVTGNKWIRIYTLFISTVRNTSTYTSETGLKIRP